MYVEKDNTCALRWSKKIRGINLLGGRCIKCGTDNVVLLEFHHGLGEKERNIKRLLEEKWSAIEEELKKCQLLCGNCHAELHCKNSCRTKRKERLLEFIDKDRCSKCGYKGKNIASLVFHHRDEDEKDFIISDGFGGSSSLTDKLLDEVEKCDILCRNCHKLIHFSSHFEKLKSVIYEKVLHPRFCCPKVNRNTIKNMRYKDKKTMKQISCELNCSRETIRQYLKGIGEKKRYRVG